jgi:hypothetical protein
LPLQIYAIPSRQSDVEKGLKMQIESTWRNQHRFNVWKSTSFQRREINVVSMSMNQHLWIDIVSTSGNPFCFHVSFSTSYRCLKAGENANRIDVGVMMSIRHACFYVNSTQTQHVLASAFPSKRTLAGNFLKTFINLTYTLIHTKIFNIK